MVRRNRSVPGAGTRSREGTRSRASGILLPRRHLRCRCCLETAPREAAESKPVSGVCRCKCRRLTPPCQLLLPASRWALPR